MTSPDNNKDPPASSNAADQQEEEDNDWKVQRDQEKSYGDNAFRARDFSTAIHHYTAALSMDPTYHIILSNRSAAYLSSHQKSKALHDAQACVTNSPPDYFKGYSRLAAALQSLGRYGPAKDAWEKVLEKDPSNTAAKKGLEHAKEILKKTQQQEEEEQQQEKKKAEEEKAKEENEKSNNEDDDDDGGDDLDDFFNDVEEAADQVQKAKVEEAEKVDKPKATNAIKSHKKDLGTATSQIERLLQPNYKWRNLNPFFVLDIPPNATEEDISRRYKALSLLLHPDKNRNQHDKAEEAYDFVQKAKTLLLDDENKAKHCRDLAHQGMRQGKREWEQKSPKEKKETSLEELQTKNIMKIFAQVEHKRREVEKRQRAQEQRERDQEEEESKKEQNAMKFEKSWKQEGRVDKRVGNWRNFSTKKKSKTSD
ncbi:Stress-induced-phosphoprotein 1 [Seminavis robusta]|uniref:Stress-induced-phosphoprotein 1 n=1 Tax=Seminavis robusta TaxID=568900 RepID=A0A9N8H5K0_9STRA|nr:Stress-induced-phosphoprotein 1 [Seminavis robusta]|eukprot:Sro88_g046420.1 Stress-induced-phosphoprotein 1 (424) ;mRNA; f:42497-43768